MNIWDEQWELGSIDISTGEKIDGSSTIRSTNKFQCEPNTEYYFKSSSVSGSAVFFYYKADGTYISYTQVSRNTTFTTPNSAKLIAFKEGGSYGTTYNNDICINVSDASFNGQYKPYMTEQSIQISNCCTPNEACESKSY